MFVVGDLSLIFSIRDAKNCAKTLAFAGQKNPTSRTAKKLGLVPKPRLVPSSCEYAIL